jgi:signal transduction histidine kinase
VTVKHEEDLVTASVQDNGKGFDADNLYTQGVGLVGMEERVRALQGRLTISSKPGEGTLVSLALPLTVEHSAARA